jgi:ketosteroid isomerase-like protein
MHGTNIPTIAPVVVLEAFFDRFGSGDIPGVLALLDEDVVWTVQGAPAVPWTGRRTGRASVEAFFATLSASLEPEAFAVDTIVGGADRAVAEGHFSFRSLATGRSFTSDFALSVDVEAGRITAYRMYEDSAAADAALAA